MKVLIGLGNEDSQYANTRHNVGADAIDLWEKIEVGTKAIAHLLEVDLKLPIISSQIKQKEIVAFKNLGSINESGNSVGAFCEVFEIDPNEVWVVVDDIDLEVGQLKIQIGSIKSKHNGIKNIVDKIGSDFNLIRVGIGKPKGHGKLLEYVLSPFEKNERIIIDEILLEALETFKKQIM